MKRLLFLVSLAFFSCAHAQQSPALPQAPSPAVAPGTSTLRPEYAPPDAAPRAATIVEGFGAPNELRDLMRAQTEAIRHLTAKVEALEAQLRRIESKLR